MRSTQYVDVAGKWNAWKILAAAALVGLPWSAARAQQAPGYYSNELEPQPSAAVSAPSDLDRDRNELIAARHRADDLAAQRDQQQRAVDALRNGSTPAPATTAAPTGDIKALQQQFDDAKAKADKIHADAVARFEQTDAWKAQFAKFDAARKDLKGPTDAVLNQLSQTHDFQDLVNAAKAAKERADQVHADKNADPKTVQDADAAFVAADNRVQETAEKALRADPRVADGRKAVDAAKAQLDSMRDKFEQDLINDPQFGPAVADVRAKQSALDAATGQAAAPSDQLPPLASGPNALADAQARLDQLNHDLDDARADVDRLTAQVRQDEDAMGVAQGAPPPDPYGYTQSQPPAYDAAPSGDVGGYGYDYGYAPPPAPYATPIYTPTVAYGGYDWWCPGLSFGISLGSYHYHNYWCGDWYSRWCGPSHYHPYSGYYGYYGGYGRGRYAYTGYYGRGGYGYSYGAYNRGVHNGYYEGSRYGRGYASASPYAYRSYASGYSRPYYDSRSAYEDRVARRYDESLAARPSYGQRSYGYVGNDYSAYRDRVERRNAENLSRTPADRSDSEGFSTPRRSVESAAPRVSREATPSYRSESSPRPSRSFESAAPQHSESASPRFDSGHSSSSSHESHESHSSESSSHSGGGDGGSSHGRSR